MAAPSKAQKAAAANLYKIAGANAQSVKDEFARSQAIYDQADTQVTQQADVQQKQASRKAAGERFGANRKLQSSVSGLMAAAGNAMQGSSARSVADMLRTRTDMDSTETLDTLRGNRDVIMNELIAALNQNVNARNEASSKAKTALRGIESDTASQLNNINPGLFAAPGVGKADFGDAGYIAKRQAKSKVAPVGGYIRGDNASRKADMLHGGLTPPPRSGHPYVR